MFGIMVALPLEARGIVTHRMQIGDTYRLSDQALLVITGMGEAARPVIQHIAAQGQCSALISLGTAVGLSPRLAAGTICIPDEVVSDQETICCHAGLQRAFIDNLNMTHLFTQQRLIHTQTILTEFQEKQSLHQRSGAVVADMESFLIGQEAQNYQLDFLVIRVIVDSLKVGLPQPILKTCVPNIVLHQLLWVLCKRPHLLLPLLRLAKHFYQSQKIISCIAHCSANVSI